MKMLLGCLWTLIVACSMKEGLGAATVNPPSGSVIGNFEGTVNFATITCDVSSSGGTILPTEWNIVNRGSADLQPITASSEFFSVGGDPLPSNPSISSNNQLTISNVTSELDGAIVYCGSGAQLQQANFTLKIYRPPNLQDNLQLRIQENRRNVPVDLREDPPSFPEPTSFNWRKDGQPLTADPTLTLTYSSATFTSFEREDTGNYTVVATNFALGDPTQQVGNDTGSFYLDVIYGPSFSVLGPTQRYVLLGDSLSLVCGTGLDSNPQATITWTAPDSTTIMDNARYDLENGPDIVRLNFTHTIPSDNGTWRCVATVESEEYVVSDGKLVRIDPAIIGVQLEHNIQLTIIAPPGQPRTLSIDNVEATSIRVCWNAPFVADSPISYYLISARNLNSTGGMDAVKEANTTNDSTFITIENLLPGTTYELTVVAVSRGGNVIARSDPSDPAVDTTGVTVPAPVCNIPQSAGGVITAMWNYTHTGGLPLTDVSVFYTYLEGATVNRKTVPDTNAATTSVMVDGLVTGFEYTFNITAENSNGSTSILCGPTFHMIGRPRTPEFGDSLTSGPNPGEVTLTIKTVASGVNDPVQNFRFVITPVLDSVEQEEIEYRFPDYKNGVLETIVVSGLEPGQTYSFSATATNFFGSSGSENSPSVRAGGARSPSPSSPPPSTSNNIGPVIGGVVGGLLLVLIIVIVIVIFVVVLVLFKKGSKGDYRPAKVEGGVYHPSPTSDNNVKVSDVDVGDDLTKQPPKEEPELQYAELETFRPPSRQKNGANEAKPMQPEEPVEYAVISSFKKKDESQAVPAPASSSDDADKAGTSTTVV